MDRQRWQRLKSVLDDALKHEGADRRTVVERFCDGNPELAEELRSLLRAAEGSHLLAEGATVEVPGLAGAVREILGQTEELPQRIGPYRIVSKLGEGGMGVVYEAEQETPRRRVAVKIVRGGQFVDEQRARLFQREADTLARLEHPGIGRIYDSGRTEDGQHYFAMELVRGETLDRYVGSRGAALPGSEVRFRLSLFRKIVDAVHYAHQRGVIHRDLKPSNIVVTGKRRGADDTTNRKNVSGAQLPEVKILDFGLARITEGDVGAVTLTTEIGVIKGTLPYMSPEQARGSPEEIDLRSDVYALGVILYEMLSGERPYDATARSLVEAVRTICEQPPLPLRKASREARRLDLDLETITGKALEKEVDRRYPSAAALSEDVSRYLTSLPILARPPSTIYQLRRFANRNKALVGGAVATLVVLIAGIVVSTSFGLREARQRREAVAARNDLQTVVDFQSDMLRQVDPQQMGSALLDDLERRVAVVARERGLPQAEIDARVASFGRSLARIDASGAALRLLDEDVLGRAADAIEKRFGGQPRIEARLRLSLGETYLELGLLDKAERFTSRAVELYSRTLGPAHEDTVAAKRILNRIRQARAAAAH